jgi:hypothetical protein
MDTIISDFVALMPEEDAATFKEWGDAWTARWKEKRMYLPPEASNRPLFEFLDYLGPFSKNKPWAYEAKKLWNTKYGKNVFSK